MEAHHSCLLGCVVPFSTSERVDGIDEAGRVLLNSFWELSVDIQQAVARFLVGSKLGEIIVAKAHGVTEVVINDVLSRLTPEARKIVEAGGHSIRSLKIKHADFDDREYLHVLYLGEDRQITGRKLEMDGTQFVKQYRAA